MAGFLDKLRARRTVLKRTRKGADLPAAVLYVEWLSGEGKRKVLDTDGGEHALPDKVLESHYKVCNKTDGQKLIDAHWAETVAGPGETVRKDD